MRRIIIIPFILIALSFKSYSQEKTSNEKVYIEFHNDSLDAFQRKSFYLKNYSKIDLSEVSFEIYSTTGKYFADIPFYVNERIVPGQEDFYFVACQTDEWSILTEDKTPIVKSFSRSKIEGDRDVVFQSNENLSSPIAEPGVYYVRLIVNGLPAEGSYVYIYLSKITK